MNFRINGTLPWAKLIQWQEYMKTANPHRQKVIDYYNSFESRFGYPLVLKGVRHFGYYPKGQEGISIRSAQEKMEARLGKLLDLPKNSLVLDAGCGEGNVAVYLAKKCNYRITGIDLLDISIRKAKEKAHRNNVSTTTTFKVGDYTKLDYPDNPFDGIYTMETLVHVKKYQQALEKFYSLLRPGGHVVLFEYTIKPSKELSPRQNNSIQEVIEETGMFGLEHFVHGKFPTIMKTAGFTNIAVEDITDRIKPMLKKFYRLGFFSYQLIKFFGLRKKFINTVFAVELYKDILENDTWRYVTITAQKSQS